ncbi:non-canonical purine NTP pyrophosphatase [Pedobacter frigidisoli]|uniref:Non-canonical purine NTP pyrophosphatase n=1 Tax=Pedobacter frigidisoli TaxID=2530455 RepID=A0A4R0NHB2_9SPHI|nr:non-canonical purine NTP pyrophosphatase [Pedobacter frigidisoli]TCC98134.1 non-canonical purine NTP pyrophosphatase [Pedobacter frigidisoli]
MDIIFATRNPTKTIEIKTMLANYKVRILTLSETCIAGEAIEDGLTLEENASKKVEHAAAQLNDPSWIMADDSGIFITALNGEPGIRSARWAGDTATTEEIMWHTLKQLNGIKDRSAVLETAIVLQSPKGEKFYFNGRTPGWLAESPKTAPKPAMPYTAIFSPDATSKVMAELSIAEQKNVSSRGKAILMVAEFLKNILGADRQ